jgi:F-type H+-transporting ATPase subunit delta
MKTPRRIKRDARELVRLCTVNGSLDEERVRRVVQHVVRERRSGGLAALSQFQRFVKLDRARHTATVASPNALPPDVRAHIETGLRDLHGDRLAVEYALDPSLIGGVRITVGSHVYDGSVKGGLEALASRFSHSRAT